MAINNMLIHIQETEQQLLGRTDPSAPYLSAAISIFTAPQATIERALLAGAVYVAGRMIYRAASLSYRHICSPARHGLG